MTGTCYFCGERLTLRRSSLMPNPDAARHLRSCWVYRSPQGEHFGSDAQVDVRPS